MTDTAVSDAVAFPQDDGTGVSDGSEDFNSAGYLGMLARAVGSEFVENGLTFSNIDTTNDTADIDAGHAYIKADQNTISVQSGSQETYDTNLPSGSNPVYVVILPTSVSLSLATDAVNDIWLFIDPSSNDSVSIRHGSSVSNPENDATPKPAIKLGTIDTSNGATTRANDTQVLDGGRDGDVNIFNGNLGFALTNANSGRIRLPNNAPLKWRNSGNTADIGINVGGFDFLVLDPDGNAAGISVTGNPIVNVGGTTDANSGAIRLNNNRSIYARNSGDSGDFGIDFTSDDIVALSNAGARVEATSEASSGEGLELKYNASTSPHGRVQAYDRGNNTTKDLRLVGDTIYYYGSTLHDFTVGSGVNLRLATGSAIEDGGGTERLGITSSGTQLKNPSGQFTFIASDTQTNIHAFSGKPLIIEDKDGDFNAVTYTTSSSAPGTLELTNSNIDASGNLVDGASRFYASRGSKIYRADARGSEAGAPGSTGATWYVHDDGTNLNLKVTFSDGTTKTIATNA